MNSKLIKYICIVLITVMVSFCFVKIINVSADSGWDSSYDSGGGSSGGSSSSSNYHSGSSSNKKTKSITKIVYDDEIVIDEDGKKVYIFKTLYKDLYYELKGSGKKAKITKSVYNDRVIIKEVHSKLEVVIYKSQYNYLYEQLRGNYTPPSKSMFLYDDRVEIAENGKTTIIYKSENEEKYNELKKEIKDRERQEIILVITIIGAIIISNVLLILLIFKTIKKSNLNTNTITLEINREEIDDEDLKKYGLNKKEITKKAYKVFYDVQIGWMEFDYDKLKELLTDELFNTYQMDLEALKIKNQKNVMSDFELIDIKLVDLKEENKTYIAEVILEVEFYDYVIDTNSKKVLRGTNKKKLDNTYILTFERGKEIKNIKCPNCGADVKGNSTGICEHCKSKIVNKNYDWVLSKKQIISQK